MLALSRLLTRAPLGGAASIGARALSITHVNNIKEFQETRDGNTLVVKAIIKPSERESLVVKPDIRPMENGKKPCYMCALELDVKHTDVLILSQFVRSDGCMLPRRITGLCKLQQKKIGTMVTMAQKAGLMINLTPSFCKKDPTKRYAWKQFNTYYDESTIIQKKKPKLRGLFRHLHNL